MGVCVCMQSTAEQSVLQLMIAKVKIVVAYVATCPPTDAAEKRNSRRPQHYLAVGTAGADSP